MKTQRFLKIMTGLLASTLLLAGCGKSDAPSNTVKLAYAEWDSCLAATEVAAAALEKAGYQVETLSVSGAMLYSALANQDVDAMVCAWLPTTHKNYYAKTEDKLENLGANMQGTQVGLVVPAYVEINSIEELTQNSELFQNRIVGIDPGAGIMELTQQALEAYDLPLELIVGSDATMTAVLQDAIRKEEAVVVTGWTPHWMFAAWDLKYLEDPKNIYGEPEHIDTLVRLGLKEDMPQVYSILQAFEMSSEERGTVMAANREENANSKDTAKAWLEQNTEQVNQWLAQ